MRYFKGQLCAFGSSYYRVFPDDVYQYYHENLHCWVNGRYMSWTDRCRVWAVKPIEVSELEVLVVLGTHAVEDE